MAMLGIVGPACEARAHQTNSLVAPDENWGEFGSWVQVSVPPERLQGVVVPSLPPSSATISIRSPCATLAGAGTAVVVDAATYVVAQAWKVGTAI
jgi:hypothetical protein